MIKLFFFSKSYKRSLDISIFMKKRKRKKYTLFKILNLYSVSLFFLAIIWSLTFRCSLMSYEGWLAWSVGGLFGWSVGHDFLKGWKIHAYDGSLVLCSKRHFECQYFSSFWRDLFFFLEIFPRFEGKKMDIIFREFLHEHHPLKKHTRKKTFFLF